MKRLYYLLIFSLIVSCKPAAKTNPNNTVKPMPESEMAFIKKITAIDSVFKTQKNDITKNEAFENGGKEIADYLLKNSNVENWVVKVHKIEVNSVPIDYIEADMFVPIGDWREEKNPDFHFPVFVALLKVKTSKVKDQLKALEKGDEVFISGQISKNSKGINLQSFSMDPDDIFENLRLDIDLTDIKKTH
jgi:hypothetical protein